MTIDLRRLNAAELALISKMPNLEQTIRFAAENALRELTGKYHYAALRSKAEAAINEVSATDAALFAEAKS